MDNRLSQSLPMVLAQRVLDLFEESGATPQEQKLALDIVRTLVIEKVYFPRPLISEEVAGG